MKNLIPYYSDIYFLILVYNRRIIFLGSSSIFYLLWCHSRQETVHKSVSDLDVKDETAGTEQNKCSKFNFFMETGEEEDHK